MYYRNRDMGINYIKARKDHRCYGMGLGIIILDDVYPGFPGDVRNASAYPFPIQYEIAEGVDIWALVHEEDKSPCLEPIKRAAKKLENMGCRAIAAECGYFAYFQKDIAGYVDVPVFMSSLLQVPFAQQLVGSNKVVGILAAREKQLTQAHLKAVGIQPGSNYVIAGAEDDAAVRNSSTCGTNPSGPIRQAPTTTRRKKTSCQWPLISIEPIPTWGPWCWNVPASNPLPVLSSGRLTSQSSVGARCWIMPTPWWSTGIITGTCNGV
jgi:hypothetical protein